MQAVALIVVEDDRGMRMLMKGWLEEVTGHEVIACGGMDDLRNELHRVGKKRVVLVTDGQLIGTETCFHVVGHAHTTFTDRLHYQVLLVSADHPSRWESFVAAARVVLALEVKHLRKGLIASRDLREWWSDILRGLSVDS